MTKIISDRQLEIIEAAGKILTASGVSGLTIKNLAREMKFSESAILANIYFYIDLNKTPSRGLVRTNIMMAIVKSFKENNIKSVLKQCYENNPILFRPS